MDIYPMIDDSFDRIDIEDVLAGSLITYFCTNCCGRVVPDCVV